ncbi:unnamed protein product [Paramecium sonneborni]|uniref:Uncharacterized protein n=1 Tax=Paramecium sonneborni TaxID=65129 RepID=A0A8S1R5N5_9CILI|nr:unnamed protein product [Paramecium sonneborni]
MLFDLFFISIDNFNNAAHLCKMMNNQQGHFGSKYFRQISCSDLRKTCQPLKSEQILNYSQLAPIYQTFVYFYLSSCVQHCNMKYITKRFMQFPLYICVTCHQQFEWQSF